LPRKIEVVVLTEIIVGAGSSVALLFLFIWIMSLREVRYQTWEQGQYP